MYHSAVGRGTYRLTLQVRRQLPQIYESALILPNARFRATFSFQRPGVADPENRSDPMEK